MGSKFDDFLQEEGILEETQEAAIKRVITYQIRKADDNQDEDEKLDR